MKNKFLRFIQLLLILFMPTLSFAGGIKGSLISDRALHIIAFSLVIIYLLSLMFSLIRNMNGTKWCGVLGFILTSLLFFPSIVLAMIFPEAGLPIALITGINYILLWRKPKQSV